MLSEIVLGGARGCGSALSARPVAAAIGLLALLVLPGCAGRQRLPAPPPNAEPQPVADAGRFDALMAEVGSAEGGIRVALRYATADNFTGAPLPGYGANRAYLRREAAAALERVAARLARDGYGLLVWDGYRPVRATLAMVAWCERTGRTDLLDQGYIARRSRHNQGVAVDLTLVRLAGGAEVEMGTPFDSFSPAAHTANASGAVAANRRRLIAAMEAEGFRNYDQEWWHFSFAVPDAVPFDVAIR